MIIVIFWIEYRSAVYYNYRHFNFRYIVFLSVIFPLAKCQHAFIFIPIMCFIIHIACNLLTLWNEFCICIICLCVCVCVCVRLLVCSYKWQREREREREGGRESGWVSEWACYHMPLIMSVQLHVIGFCFLGIKNVFGWSGHNNFTF
jgi:hypothetical protein